MRLVLILILSFLGSSLLAQVRFSEKPKIQALMSRYEKEGRAETSINGWRIKLISTTNRRTWENAESKFRSLYPEFRYSNSYENPYYSLKVGAFETRYDLESYLQRFKNDFREAIPFRDRIEKTELFETD